jgi:hypothetical protein
VLTATVPWARPGSRFTAAFEEHAAWLCAQMPWTKAAKLLRVTWRTLQAVVERVASGLRGGEDDLDRLHDRDPLPAPRRSGSCRRRWRRAGCLCRPAW